MTRSQAINRLLLVRLSTVFSIRANYFAVNDQWRKWVAGMERATGKKFR